MFRKSAVVMSLMGFAAAVSSGALAGAGGNTNASIAGKVARGPTTTACGALGKFKVLTDDTLSKWTGSTGFVDIPNGEMTFSVSGPAASCVIVSFSSNAYAAGRAAEFVQAVIDSSAVAKPGPVQFAASDGTYNFAKSFDFIFPAVAPGTHTVKMQFRSFDGQIVFINKHTMMLNFR